MKFGMKFGAMASAMFLLAACETPPRADDVTAADMYGDGSGAVAYETLPAEYEPFVTNVGDRVFFGYDSSVLNAEARATLSTQVQWLKGHPEVRVIIEGHCDERGTREYNLALGERRANSARDYMVSLGLSPRRVTTVSYGKERPAVVGSNEGAWSKNRRSVTVLAH